MKNLIIAICLTLSIFLLNGTTFATTIVETPDAGDTMASAMVLPGGTTQVSGTVGVTYDIDMYKFYIDTTSLYEIYMASAWPLDANLLLFNEFGQGLEGDDDDGGGPDGTNSLISRSLQVGWYFIAVADNDLNAYDEFDNWFLLNDSGPLATATSETLDHFGTPGGDTGEYILTFSPATGSSPVPEPSTMILLSFGILGLAGISRKK